MQNLIRYGLIAVITLFPAPGSAQVHKCVTADGRIEYRQTPCVEGPGGSTRRSEQTLSTPPGSSTGTTPGTPGLRPGERALIEQLDREDAERERQQKLRSAANRGRVRVGMTDKQVERAWGEPDKVNRTVTGSTISEQWVYRCGAGCAQYIYLRDGEVTSFQD